MRLYAFIFLILIANPAYAYLDPGTGSMLLYFILGVIATFVYYAKEAFYKVKNLFSGESIDKSLSKPEGADLLFFSEGASYWSTFLPIIEALEKLEINSIYYTLDEQDPALKSKFKYLQTSYIGSSYSTFALLNRLEIKVVVMTTPQLDVMHLKRSKNVDCYVHVVHAPTDALMYKKFAFDYFDVIMCSGNHQIKSIRALEKIRSLPAKQLLETGLPYYDILAREVQKTSSNAALETLLVAPTWGATGMFTKYGVDILDEILKTGLQIIVRPHPQSFISEIEVIEQITAKCELHSNLILDSEPSAAKSMANAHALLSDVSGIIFDFYFIFKKPVIVLEGAYQPAGYEAEDVDFKPWEIDLLPKMATLVKNEQIDNLALLINNALSLHDKAQVEQMLSESVFNFANAGNVAAQQLRNLLGK